MRSVSRRFRERLRQPWAPLNEVSWSNNGGQTWTPAGFVSGSVTTSALSQIRWTTSLTLEAPSGPDGINAFTTRLRIDHGMSGEPLLPMGRYKVTRVRESDATPGLVEIEASSYEVYVIRARFERTRTFASTSASELCRTLIREVLPDATLHWTADNPRVPRVTEDRDRWGLIDGDRDSVSAARVAGARVFTGPRGEWLAKPIPTLEDPVRWTARRGEVLLTAERELSDENVCNVMVVRGEPEEGQRVFPPGIAKDMDPASATYVGRTPDQGGFGISTRFYTSQMVTSAAQADQTARALLAPYLGLRQQITWSSLHNPLIEAGDVGEVHSRLGVVRVLLDSVTLDLLGGPTSGETRTTATRYAGQTVQPADEDATE